MTYDPHKDFVRYRVSGFTGPDGRGWRIVDKVTGDVVAEFPIGNGQRRAYLQAQAEAARRNLAHYETVRGDA